MVLFLVEPEQHLNNMCILDHDENKMRLLWKKMSEANLEKGSIRFLFLSSWSQASKHYRRQFCFQSLLIA